MATDHAPVILVAYRERQDAVEIAEEMTASFDKAGIDVRRVFDHGEQETSPLEPGSLVVSLGGDGTFLRAARMAHSAGCEIMGVNLGRVGFLLSVSPDSIAREIERARTGQLALERRVALRVSAPADGINEVCLNEVVVERSQAGHMVRVRTSLDGDEFLTYSADGVMVATATGSTGYNFSAGGPVVSPELDVLVMTPVAPHFTIDRSIVFGRSQVLELTTIDQVGVVVADGTVCGQLSVGSVLSVTCDPSPVNVLVSERIGLGTRLRRSLREGHA